MSHRSIVLGPRHIHTLRVMQHYFNEAERIDHEAVASRLDMSVFYLANILSECIRSGALVRIRKFVYRLTPKGHELLSKAPPDRPKMNKAVFDAVKALIEAGKDIDVAAIAGQLQCKPSTVSMHIARMIAARKMFRISRYRLSLTAPARPARKQAAPKPAPIVLPKSPAVLPSSIRPPTKQELMRGRA